MYLIEKLKMFFGKLFCADDHSELKVVSECSLMLQKKDPCERLCSLSCRRKSRGTKDQLLIDKAVLKDCRKRRTILAMTSIDYRKAYDSVLHIWIL